MYNRIAGYKQYYKSLVMLFRPTRRTLAIDKTLFRSLISLDPIRNAL